MSLCFPHFGHSGDTSSGLRLTDVQWEFAADGRVIITNISTQNAIGDLQCTLIVCPHNINEAVTNLPFSTTGTVDCAGQESTFILLCTDTFTQQEAWWLETRQTFCPVASARR